MIFFKELSAATSGFCQNLKETDWFCNTDTEWKRRRLVPDKTELRKFDFGTSETQLGFSAFEGNDEGAKRLQAFLCEIIKGGAVLKAKKNLGQPNPKK